MVKVYPFAPWTMAQADTLINRLKEPLRLHGYGLGLTGSVLWAGASQKDLDLIVYHLQDVPGAEWSRAKQILRVHGLRLMFGFSQVRKKRQSQGLMDRKHVEIWTIQQTEPGPLQGLRRVDLFFMGRGR